MIAWIRLVKFPLNGLSFIQKGCGEYVKFRGGKLILNPAYCNAMARTDYTTHIFWRRIRNIFDGRWCTISTGIVTPIVIDKYGPYCSPRFLTKEVQMGKYRVNAMYVAIAMGEEKVSLAKGIAAREEKILNIFVRLLLDHNEQPTWLEKLNLTDLWMLYWASARYRICQKETIFNHLCEGITKSKKDQVNADFFLLMWSDVTNTSGEDIIGECGGLYRLEPKGLDLYDCKKLLKYTYNMWRDGRNGDQLQKFAESWLNAYTHRLTELNYCLDDEESEAVEKCLTILKKGNF